MSSLVCRVCLLLCVLVVMVESRQFNYEVEKRIRERLDFFLSGPVDTARVLSGFRHNGGFPNNMAAADRDRFLALAYSVMQPLVYFGLEDGTCPGYYWSSGYYREPGNAGYSLDNPEMQKHLNSCVDPETGEPTQCLLPPGAQYIACRGEKGNEQGLCPEMEPCPNQPACALSDEHCQASVKWCRQYSIMQAPSSLDPTGRGYIPITNFCHNDKGQFTQQDGAVLDPFGDDRETSERVSCRFGDGSLVQRNVSGDYAACGGDGKVCDTVFAGGYSSSEYDPRYRPWYIKAKELQKAIWLPPFAFFTLGLGITFAEPIYSIDGQTGRQVFAGVIAVDYRFEDIAEFLVESYGKTDTAVLIYEVEEPNYIIASSTGGPSSRFVLSEDLTQPCPVDRGEQTGCEPVRLSVKSFGEGNPMDSVLVKAAARHDKEGYPRELLSIKPNSDINSPVYVSQSTTFTQQGTDLAWHVVVVEPGVESSNDTLSRGDTMFAVVCVIGGLGCSICAWFAVAMYRRRAEKAVVFADWRFTCAFIVGCVFFNASTLTLLGENTKATCLLRMWTFHLSFATALSPLFVKVWRMYKLVGSINVRRNSISNAQAVLYSLPMILVQMAILLVFSFVDPPRPMEYVEEDGGTFVHGVVCNTDTNAYLYTLGAYETAFVFVGCILAYMTRNMHDDFGEAKQMLFSMYNIFFVGLIVFIAVQVIGLEGNEQSILQAVGVFWGTVVSAGAFVIPRLLQAQEIRRIRGEGHSTNVHISGLDSYHTTARDKTAPTRASNLDSNLESNRGSLDVIEENEMEELQSSEILGTVQDSGNGDPKSDYSNELAVVKEQVTPSNSPRSTRIDFAGEVSSDAI